MTGKPGNAPLHRRYIVSHNGYTGVAYLSSKHYREFINAGWVAVGTLLVDPATTPRKQFDDALAYLQSKHPSN